MITIDNNYGDFEATLISPEGEELGIITNIISLDYVRAQIKKEQKAGYKLRYEDYDLTIDRNGNLSEWPNSLCYYTDILLDLL